MPFFNFFASPRWSPLRMRTKWCHFSFFFKSFQKKQLTLWACIVRFRTIASMRRFWCDISLNFYRQATKKMAHGCPRRRRRSWKRFCGVVLVKVSKFLLLEVRRRRARSVYALSHERWGSASAARRVERFWGPFWRDRRWPALVRHRRYVVWRRRAFGRRRCRTFGRSGGEFDLCAHP